MNFVGFQTLIKRETNRFFRLPINTIVPSLVSLSLYLLVFGFSLGSRIQEVGGMPYLDFIVPGLILMNVIIASYSNPSGSLFFSRQIIRSINDILVSPMSYMEMVFGFIIGGMMRGLTLGFLAYLITLIFSPIGIHNIFIALYFAMAASFLFSCFGIVVGLWAKNWESLNIFLNFFLTPLTFLGGVFYSLDMLPSALQTFTFYNPIFYLINGFRYGLLGYSDASVLTGAILLFIASIVMFVICVQLFKKGWHLRS